MNNSNSFYKGLTPFYHLIYPDWEGSIKRQASDLKSVIAENWGEGVSSVYDVSCGIGTQALGLAELGYSVTGSDISSEEINRAKEEANKKNLEMEFMVSDMRELAEDLTEQFDVVMSCDNSVPHLLTDEDILKAFRELWRCAKCGGGCIITVRDYDLEDFSQTQVKPYGIRDHEGIRYLLWQVWEPQGNTYDVTLYLVEDNGSDNCRTHIYRTSYYSVGISRLMELMKEAGFATVKRLDGRFFQPMIIGTKTAGSRGKGTA